MDEEQADEEQGKYSTSTIIIVVIAVIVIFFLAFLLYYYSTAPIHFVLEGSVLTPKNNNIIATKESEPPRIIPTNIIEFIPPVILPAVQKDGECSSSSFADPYREDAWRCMVQNDIYDPCFTTSKEGFVYCQVGIDGSTGFLLKLKQALPEASLPEVKQSNLVWFVELKDGTYCSPFTVPRPSFGKDQIAYYECRPKNSVLLGDLIEGVVWKANEAILTKVGDTWKINSLQQVDINMVWR